MPLPVVSVSGADGVSFGTIATSSRHSAAAFGTPDAANASSGFSASAFGANAFAAASCAA